MAIYRPSFILWLALATFWDGSCNIHIHVLYCSASVPADGIPYHMISYHIKAAVMNGTTNRLSCKTIITQASINMLQNKMHGLKCTIVRPCMAAVPIFFSQKLESPHPFSLPSCPLPPLYLCSVQFSSGQFSQISDMNAMITQPASPQSCTSYKLPLLSPGSISMGSHMPPYFWSCIWSWFDPCVAPCNQC